MAAWKFCLQNGGVSDIFIHKMAALVICPQNGGMTAFLTFTYKMAAWVHPSVCLSHRSAAAAACRGFAVVNAVRSVVSVRPFLLL